MKLGNIDIAKRHVNDFRRTILVVDDEPVNSSIMGVILGEEYNVIYADSGEKALEEIEKQGDYLSLVLLDLHMGGMHGYEVLDILKRNGRLKTLPVIVLTSDKAAEVESLEHGAVDFLGKPFDKPQVIKARINRAIELYIDRKIIKSTGLDPLTGLLTKQFLYQYAEEYDKFHPDAGVDAIVVNFSKFHLINELYGRAYGDKILCCIADGVRCIARAHGGVASRVDADMFYLYIEHQENYDEIARLIRKPIENMMNPSDIRLRIGICSDPDRKASLYQRFDRAVTACNSHSKGVSAMPYTLYDSNMHEQEIYEARLLENIDAAFKDGQFHLVFQPKYNITGDEPILCGTEVLVRWNHPKYGNVRPDFFIPLFEDNGIINNLDRYVWEKAAEQISRWKDKYGVKIPLSVNVSRVDIFDPDFVVYLNKLVEDNELKPEDIHLEITETAYTSSSAQIIRVARKLQEEGFKLEMDDFGKGYSSLNMLTSLPIDVLKLDMGFIRGIEKNNREMKMVELVIDIGKFLGVPIVAEGVESKEQYLLLKEAGCDVIQGYYFSKPIPAEEFEKLIEKEFM